MAKLKPPKDSVTVRMYRIGHGDCFLLAMPRQGGGNPVYVLIDCGYKPGSPAFIETSSGNETSIEDIVQHLGEATDFHLDLVIITHEHQDHLNGIWKKNEPYFKDFEIEEAWLAWTEDPDDDLANELRRKHRDQLLELVEARKRLALAVGEADASIKQLDELLAFEIGMGVDEGPAGEFLAAASDPEKSVNKQGLKLVCDKARENRGVEYLNPGGTPLEVPGTGVQTYVLGPPRDPDLLADEDPVGDESFPMAGAHGLSFRAAATTEGGGASPFAARYSIPMEVALADPNSFFHKHYGSDGESVAGETSSESADESPFDSPWRRIDAEWLFSAEELALKLNTGVNNTSLALAFELPTSKKVLLFAGDAQRGNWISWANVEWDGEDEVSTRDLLARTVLYKVCHHASHNATLNGKVDDEYANLAWMGLGDTAGEFTAMIPAVNEWAMTKNNPPWRHPLPSIKKALLSKAHGRVFQTDEAKPEKPDSVSQAKWDAFLERCQFHDLHFDYVVRDRNEE